MSSVSNILRKVQVCEELLGSFNRQRSPSSGPLRIGVIFSNIPGWGAGIGFYRMFVRSLDLVARECGVEVGLVVDRRDENALASLAGLPGERWSMLLGKDGGPSLSKTVSFHRIHCFVDLFNSQPWTKGLGTVVWLPDFQHLHLKHHFTPQELEVREKTFEERATKGELVICSSEAVAADFRSVFPDQQHKAVVARFPSNLVFEAMPASSPEATLTKYHLPGKYALVANQYWSHKNHQVVIDAVAKAKEAGITIPVVLTGLPLESREPTNKPTSELLQSIAKRGLAGQVIPLGQVPYQDLMQLMRRAALIIQPSRFEGWSTIVQDAKALGRPVMCSDIPVHREQAPRSLGFFGCDDASTLTRLLVEHWPSLDATWNPKSEADHLRQHLEVARDYGRTLADTAKSAYQSAQQAAASV